MKTNNRKTSFKLLLSIALIAVMSLNFSCKKDKEEAVDTVNAELNIEKDDVLAQLNEVSKLYDLALEEKKGVSEELVAAKARIKDLIDSLKVADVNVKNIVKYKMRNEEMKSEMLTLLKDNEELVQNSKILVHSLTKRKAQLAEQKKLNQKLAVKNETLHSANKTLSTKIEKAAVLSIAKLNGVGLKERSSGRITETSKARRVNKLKICYTVAKNPLLEAGERTLYIQVIDSEDNVMGENELKKFDSKELYYSLESTFEYTNETLDVCEFLPRDKFEKGSYFINVFNEDQLLSSSSITLD